MRFASIFVSIMIIFSAVAFADCQQYVDNAQTDLIYPNYLSAAGEFQLAAQCYEKAGNNALAIAYYNESADKYILGAEALISSGDYAQKAQSYESAADAYMKIGNKALAVDNYNLAKKWYITAGRISDTVGGPSNAESVQVKIDAMSKDSVPIIPILYDILIIAVVLVLIYIAFKAFKKFTRNDVRGFSSPSYEQPIVRRSADQFKSTFIPPVREEPVFKKRDDTAKQRAIDKLRSKYAP